MILPFLKTYKKFFITSLLLLAILLYFLYKYNNILDQKHKDIFVSNQIQIVEDELENQKNQALSLALMFSQNQDIILNLKNKNNIELKKELLKILSIIENYTKQNIDIQIHTKDLEVFTRTWEDKDFGLKLDSFREGLVKVRNTQEPFVSSELGKRFNIKAIAPIYDDDYSYIGSVEVIVDFSSLANRLKNLGIESIFLLEKEYLNIAKYYENALSLGDFVVIQNNFSKTLYEIILKNKASLMQEKLYYEFKDKIITKIPLGEFANKSVGILVMCFDKNNKSFAYLPKYDYFGDINIEKTNNNLRNIEKKEIIIK